MSLHGYFLHCVQISMLFCLAHWRILQSGGPPPVLHAQFKSISFLEEFPEGWERVFHFW